MARVRKLVLAIAAASALTSGMAHALGLGEVTLKSALNQPFEAEIELVEVRDLASNEVIPNLASPEEFNKAGIDRQYFLTDLKFTPILKPNGKSVIRVTSSKPVREPYLNFLVEVLWPSGRALREYTVLLDPPLYSPQAAAAAAPKAPVAAPAPKPVAPTARPAAPVAAAPAPAPTPAPAAPAARPAAPAPAPAPAGKAGDETYKTTSRDTLWEVAQRTRSSGSVQQAMLAIQDLNPDAFVDGNINRLKSGQVLRLPDDQQIKARSQSEAIAQVASQTSAWREGRSLAGNGARQLDATKRASAGEAPAKTEEKDSLKLLSGEAGKATKGGEKGASGDSKALNDKLAVTKESLDSTRRENDELKSRMGDLQSQLDKLNRLIQLKDSQMAKLQADIAAKDKKSTTDAAAAASAAATVPAPAAEPAKPAAAAPAAPSTPTPAPAPTPAPGAEEAKPAAPDYNYSEESAKPAETPAEAAKVPAEAAPAPAPEPAPAPVPKVETPAVVPAPVEPVAEETSLVDDLLANPMLLGVAGGGALLLLLVGLMVLSRRNAQKEADLHSVLAAQDEQSPFDNDLDVPDTSFDGLDSELDEPAAPTKEERVTAQTGDVLGEADIYIAYGRFTQAAELLQDAINNEPQRADLRLKLMEVQAELGDQEGFARQERELSEIGGANSEVEQLKSRYPGMAAAAVAGFAGVAAASALDNDADNFSLDDLTLDEPQAAAAPVDEMDLSLDDLEAELDRDLTSNDSLNDFGDLALDDELGTSSPAASGLSDLDFDLSLDDAASTTTSSAALSDDLADFSLDLDEPKAAATSISEEDDFLLSLDDELSSTTSSDDFADLSLEPDAALELDAGLDSERELPADFDLSLSDDAPAEPASDASFAAKLDEVTAELDQLSESLDVPEEDDFDALIAPASSPAAASLDADDDFDFLSGTDETATKLDLARAYIDMGDTEGARDILDEVISEGSDAQQQEARELISRIA